MPLASQQEVDVIIAPSARYMRSLLQGTWREHRGSVYRVSLPDTDHFDAYKLDVHTTRVDRTDRFTKRLIKIDVCDGGVRAFWGSRYLLVRGAGRSHVRWAGQSDRDVFDWHRP